jgi:HD-GYP domain-containing protein (c-di-GMP phosphodiesterase class II)
MLQNAPRWNAMDGAGWRPDGVEVSTVALLELVEEAAPGVAAHMERTGRLARLLALELGLSSHLVDLVVRTARVHDVGKLTIPPWVFEKAGPLTPAESALKEAHSVTGQRILERKPSLIGLGPLVRAIHERWDGTGYPDGLKGSAIPLPSRIVAVCDAFDAMTDRRSGEDTTSITAAVEELRRASGTRFDPCVVDPFCDLLETRVGPLAQLA